MKLTRQPGLRRRYSGRSSTAPARRNRPLDIQSSDHPDLEWSLGEAEQHLHTETKKSPHAPRSRHVPPNPRGACHDAVAHCERRDHHSSDRDGHRGQKEVRRCRGMHHALRHMRRHGGRLFGRRQRHQQPGCALRTTRPRYRLFCPPGGVPQLRGMVERMFRSIDEGLLSRVHLEAPHALRGIRYPALAGHRHQDHPAKARLRQRRRTHREK
jgi:hypothetical protein